MESTSRFDHFIESFTQLIEQGASEEQVFSDGKALMVDLVSNDDWLPEEFAQPSESTYQQFLLHCDPQDRFSVASFVWGPGQTTPVHDHTVWGMVGILRGAETCDEYAVSDDGIRHLGQHLLNPGEVDLVSPTVGDVHKVSNAHEDKVSISIHVYGADIGKVQRHTFNPETGTPADFISGYTNRA
ncbi:cysteine dioxygenase [Pontibacterium granulatum]|uniref:cysteine dioxygenase family protein n=1 Tax=Pontibacterium granulatum TaxID=2036029 RepID=UPI00249C9F5A|nr:cysteine dioxygenase [Pontibacterium granulatum]MDI3323947.1 cysteine dioxygenase [Pontibacterium granulatum]